jgi:hypothetical protein
MMVFSPPPAGASRNFEIKKELEEKENEKDWKSVRAD